MKKSKFTEQQIAFDRETLGTKRASGRSPGRDARTLRGKLEALERSA